ncbi:MAG: DUF1566 domain-containing protein, partial [Bacteroidetes bacterium]|nr:DUF1566 domain-containing protein [Bacteroidota bacterium]
MPLVATPMKDIVTLLALIFVGVATASMAQNPNAIPTSQSYKTSNKGYECYAVTERKDCEKCEAKGEYGQVSTPTIPCFKCKGVSKPTLAKFPCTSCSNTREVKDPNYVPPRKCEGCNGRGKVLTLGHKIQVADADYTEQLSWDDAMYVCSNFGDGWRLPTKEELTGMYEFLYRKGKGNFKTDHFCWSSSENNTNTALGFRFESEQANYNIYSKDYTKYARAVRTSYEYETFTIDGETFQVANEDLPADMTWDDAIGACQSLGNGWRLPSKEELKEMYNQLYIKGKSNIKLHNPYWSSSENNEGYAWDFSFVDKSYYLCNKGFKNYGRAVRHLKAPHQGANSSNQGKQSVPFVSAKPTQELNPSNQAKQSVPSASAKIIQETVEINQETRIEVTPVVEMEEEIFSEPEIFNVVEEMPSFPGGDQELLKFMAENTKYPPLARENGLQGIVVVTF